MKSRNKFQGISNKYFSKLVDEDDEDDENEEELEELSEGEENG